MKVFRFVAVCGVVALLLAADQVWGDAGAENVVAGQLDPVETEKEDSNLRHPIVQEHHLSDHTRLHDPCILKMCTSQQTCEVITNPALQFPIAHCKDASTPAATIPAASDGGVTCLKQQLRTSPMACYSQDAWLSKALAHCDDTAMTNFEAQVECLSFDPTPVFQFANFQCCHNSNKHQRSSKPAEKPTAKPVPKKERVVHPEKPKQPKTATKEAVRATTEKATTTTGRLTTGHQQTKPPTAHPRQPSAKPEPQARTTEAEPQSSSQQPEDPKPTVDVRQPHSDVHPAKPHDEKAPPHRPVEVEGKPDTAVDDEERAGVGGDDDHLGSGMANHWFGVIVASVVVVAIIAVVGIVTYKMRRNKQVVHRKQLIFSKKDGMTLAFRRKSQNDDDDSEEDDDDDETLYAAGADGLAFDDTEVQNFVNPAAVYANVSYEEDDPAVIEPTAVEHWDMKSSTYIQHDLTILNKTI